MNNRLTLGFSSTALWLAVVAVACATPDGAPVAGAPAGVAGDERAVAVQRRRALDLSSLVDVKPAPFHLDDSGYEALGASFSARVSSHGLRMSLVGTGPTLDFETVGVGRGGNAGAVPPTGLELKGDGVVRSRGKIWSEQFETHRHGVEQSWEFPEKPSGHGDLVIRIAVSGGALTGSSSQALRFARPAGGEKLAYGRATWVDASGRKEQVDTAYRDGTIVLTVPEGLVERSSYPAVLDPLIGPEVDVDIATLAGSNSNQSQAAVAFDGVNYLVVWSDTREFAKSDIWGARVTKGGVILDPVGIQISSSGHSYSPAISFDGTGYLVAWTDTRNGNEDIFVARVSIAGSVLDPSGTAVSTASGSQGYPSVAHGGSTSLVVWQDGRNGGSDIYGARVGTNGVVVDPLGLEIYKGGNGNQTPAVAFDGSQFRVVWNDSNGVTSKRVAANGVADAAKTPLFGGIPVGPPALACAPSNCLVTASLWANDPVLGDTRYDVMGAQVGPNNQFLGEVPISMAVNNQRSPAVAFDGTNYLVTWQDERNDANPADSSIPCDVYMTRVSAAGTVLDPAGVLAIVPGQVPNVGDLTAAAIAFDGTNYLLAFPDFHANAFSSQVHGTRISKAPAAIDASGFLISSLARAAWSPAIATDGTSYLVTWTSYLDATQKYNVYAAIVDASGAVQSPGVIGIGTGPLDQGSAAAAWNGSSYLVTWDEGNSTLGVRLSSQGAVLGPSSFVVSSTPVLTSVASDGASFFVASTSGAAVSGVRVNAAGTVLDATPIVLSSAAGGKGYLSAAFDGTDYVMVWEDHRNPSTDIYGVRVSPAGVVGTEFVVSGGQKSETKPRIACNVGFCVVAWHDIKNGTGDVYATRLQGDQVLDPVGILVAADAFDETQYNYSFLTLGADSQSFLVAWPDRRSGKSSDIYGSWLTPAGVVVNPTGIPLSVETTSEYMPQLASAGPGKFLLGYLRFMPTAGLHSQRTEVRSLTWGVASDPCSVPEDCASGLCVGGTCCGTPCDPDGGATTGAGTSTTSGAGGGTSTSSSTASGSSSSTSTVSATGSSSSGGEAGGTGGGGAPSTSSGGETTSLFACGVNGGSTRLPSSAAAAGILLLLRLARRRAATKAARS